MSNVLEARNRFYLHCSFWFLFQEGGTIRDKINLRQKLEKETGIKFLNIEEVAILMGISKNTANKIFHTENFPSFKPGKEFLVEKTALMDFYGFNKNNKEN